MRCHFPPLREVDTLLLNAAGVASCLFLVPYNLLNSRGPAAVLLERLIDSSALVINGLANEWLSGLPVAFQLELRADICNDLYPLVV